MCQLISDDLIMQNIAAIKEEAVAYFKLCYLWAFNQVITA